MNSFILKAKTVERGNWYPFSLKDIPAPFDEEHLALLMNAGSPLLITDTIVRGDPETKLYEGDIVRVDDTDYLICYERGFYAISKDYVVKNLYSLEKPELIGNYWDNGFPIEMRTRKKQLYHYEQYNFKLTDIVGHLGNKLLIRACTLPIAPDDCKQECCMKYEGKRVFLGDTINDKPVVCAGGRICIQDDQGYFDLAKGVYLNGYNPGNIR